MSFNNLPDSINLCPAKSPTCFQSDRIKPKLGDVIITLHMNMLEFVPIACVEKESIRPDL